MKTKDKERFLSKVSTAPGQGPAGGCHEWQAGKFKLGYGQFWLSPRTRCAHQIAFVIEFGEVPEGKQVLHRCDNPPCCNPAHLFLGTHAENMKDKMLKGRHRTGPQNQTHCKNGHELKGPNLTNSTRQRQCRICKNARRRKQ